MGINNCSLYAPIIIPTCNRVEHLKKCLGSIEKNPEAKYTEVYISVDYPPSEKFRPGYKDVVDYLLSLESDNKFKNLKVYYQDRNLGPFKNIDFLIGKVREKHSCLIFSEDDNIFSDKALSFFNASLLKYKNDNNVIFASGCNTSICDNEKAQRIVLRRYPIWYGIAYWLEDYDKGRKWITSSRLNAISMNIGDMIKIRKKSILAFNTFFEGYVCAKTFPYVLGDGSIYPIDCYFTIYTVLTNKLVAYPKMNLVKNIGNDGTGVNCQKGDKEFAEIVDTKFDFKCTDT